jgi:hypothetical protein
MTPAWFVALIWYQTSGVAAWLYLLKLNRNRRKAKSTTDAPIRIKGKLTTKRTEKLSDGLAFNFETSFISLALAGHSLPSMFSTCAVAPEFHF